MAGHCCHPRLAPCRAAARRRPAECARHKHTLVAQAHLNLALAPAARSRRFLTLSRESSARSAPRSTWRWRLGHLLRNEIDQFASRIFGISSVLDLGRLAAVRRGALAQLAHAQAHQLRAYGCPPAGAG